MNTRRECKRRIGNEGSTEERGRQMLSYSTQEQQQSGVDDPSRLRGNNGSYVGNSAMGYDYSSRHWSNGVQMYNDRSLPHLIQFGNHMQKPMEHYLKVAKDGTILEASDTVTGVNPNSLQMTSFYKSVHPDDLPGLKAVSKYFWDNGDTDMTSYLRRKTDKGKWIWLASTLSGCFERPVPGVMIRETIAGNAQLAKHVSRVTRIAAIIANAIESARVYEENRKAREKEECYRKNGDNYNGLNSVPLSKATKDDSENNGMEDLLEFVREGVSLDMSKIVLSTKELEMVTKFLTGRLELEDLAPLVSHILSNPDLSIEKVIDEYISVKQIYDRKSIELSKDRKASSASSFTTVASAFSESSVQSGRSSKSGRSLNGSTQTTSNHLYAVKRYDAPLAFCGRSNHLVQLQNMNMWHRRDDETLQQQNIDQVRHRNCSMKHSDNVPSTIRSSRSRHANGQKYNAEKDILKSDDQLCKKELHIPPPLSVINMAYSNIGNFGIEILSEILHVDTPLLKTLDIGFCSIDEKGILTLCRALRKRKKRGLPNLQGLILSGNTISYKGAKDLGTALSTTLHVRKRSIVPVFDGTGYDEDHEDDTEDEGEEDLDANDPLFGRMIGVESAKRGYVRRNKKIKRRKTSEGNIFPKAQSGDQVPSKPVGLTVLHLACCSLNAKSFYQILVGLGQDCPLKELCVPSNNLGSTGATLLMEFLDGVGIPKFKKNGNTVMPHLERIDLSNNKLSNDGVAALTKAITKRKKNNFAEIRLSTNDIGPLGIETIMNKLFQHKIRSLFLDNNVIGDKGCQLVAASLPSMHSLLRLSLSFNRIGTRGISSLSRALLGCESLMSLKLSGNTVKVSGSISMGFCLLHHPRLEELELDNCCLSQAAQCHIVSGIISNRWVPMKNVVGFSVAPPLIAMGALDIVGQTLGNEECFQIRRDIQMRLMLERNGKRHGGSANEFNFSCLLEWLPNIPFDEDELLELQNYFLETEGAENSDSAAAADMNVVLKHRGDLLANLSSKAAEEIRDHNPLEEENGCKPSQIGLPLDSDYESENDLPLQDYGNNEEMKAHGELNGISPPLNETAQDHNADLEEECLGMNRSLASNMSAMSRSRGATRDLMSASKSKLDEEQSQVDVDQSNGKVRISRFPHFEAKLQALKTQAQSIMDQEFNPLQQDVIAQEFAEASLTHLRELKYRCMQDGLDGWRVGTVKRKVLIIDDSCVTRKMIARAFEKANFIVDTAENGMEGVKKLKNSIYDIAFMDIQMPVLNGFEATKELREWEDLTRPGVRQPICALTATYVDDFERSELMKFKDAGLDVMESKPCNIPRLFKVVDDVSPMFSDLKMNSSLQEP